MNPVNLGRTIVLDTSVVAKWFLPETLSAEADSILEEIRLGKTRAAAPDLIVYEFANILWQRRKKDMISGRQAAAIMSDFERLPIELVPGDVLGSEALKIASNTGCTAYDGAFMALASGINGILITADRKFIRLMDGTRLAKRVVWLGEGG
ncbi:MAG: type II toxin-antitoxin system VapC family toxin [Thermoleophilia bacterium]